jgi:hypothetical protein
VLKHTDNCWKQSVRKEQGVERKKNTGKLRQQGNRPVSQQKRSQLPRLFFDNMQHGLQPEKNTATGKRRCTRRSTPGRVCSEFSLFFFFFFLFSFLFFVFSFFTYPTGQTTRPRRTGGGAGQNASTQDATCRVTGWASFFFLETGYCGCG